MAFGPYLSPCPCNVAVPKGPAFSFLNYYFALLAVLALTASGFKNDGELHNKPAFRVLKILVQTVLRLTGVRLYGACPADLDLVSFNRTERAGGAIFFAAGVSKKPRQSIVLPGFRLV